MSHENTITIESDGKFFNIPTVIKGKQLTDKQAFQHFKKTRKNFGIFRKLEGALFSARRRSAKGHQKSPKKSRRSAVREILSRRRKQ